MGFVLFSCFAIFLQRLIFCFFAKFFFCKVLFSQVFSLFSASFCFWQGDVLFATVFFFARFFFHRSALFATGFFFQWFFVLVCLGVFFCQFFCFFFCFQWIFFERFFFLGQGFCVFCQWVFCFCVARCIVSVYFCDDFLCFFPWCFSCNGYCVFLLEGVFAFFFACFFFFCLFFALDSVIFLQVVLCFFFFWPRVLCFFLLLVWCYFFCFFSRFFSTGSHVWQRVFFSKKKKGFLLKLFVHEVGFSPKRLFFISSEIDVLFCFFKKKGSFFSKEFSFLFKGFFFSNDFLLQGLFSSVFFFQTCYSLFLFSIFFQCFLASFYFPNLFASRFFRKMKVFFQGFVKQKKDSSEKKLHIKERNVSKKRSFLNNLFL